MNTQELRDTFQVAGLFQPGQVNGTFTDLDRLVVGGAMPLKPVELPNHQRDGPRVSSWNDANSAPSMSAARAGGSADGKSFALEKLDCVYLPMGTKSVNV